MSVAGDIKVRTRLDVLDYLRFLAAILVVAYHYFAYAPIKGHVDVALTPFAEVAKYGYLGVDLFFLISGFVIAASARNRTAVDFAVGRATRLYPAFWPAMLLTALALALWGDRVNLGVSLGQVLVNLTMVPGLFGVPAVDGVYWSLLYELEFYGIVFLLLLRGQGKRIGQLAPFWAVAMLAATLLAPALSRSIPFAGGYFGYFVVGALLAQVRLDGRLTLTRMVGLGAGGYVAVSGAAAYSKAVAESLQTDISIAVVTVVVLIWMFLVSALALPSVGSWRLPFAERLGGLTYPLYLTHAVLGYVAMSFVINEANKWWVYAAVAAGALMIATGLHHIERLALWRRFFGATLGRALRPLQGTAQRSVEPSHADA